MAIDRRMNALRTKFSTKKILSDYRARSADKWTTAQRKDYAQEEKFFAQLERQQDMEILLDDIFEKKYQKLEPRMITSAKKMNNDTKSFAASLLKTDKNDNEISIYNWTVLEKNFKPFIDCLKINHEADYDNKCRRLFQNNEINYDSSNSDLISEGKDIVLDCDNMNRQYQKDIAIDMSCLNKGQAEIISIYHDYLYQEKLNSHIESLVPDIVLLTGKGGTGKSYVIHKLLEIGNQNKAVNCIWTMANNNLNAADINGCTIASLLCQRFISKTEKDSDPKDLLWKIPQQAISNLQDQDIENTLRLLILDEVSNITAQKIGQLSRLFRIGKNNDNALFGGIKVLLVGDFNQKKPVGQLLTASLIDWVQNKYNNEIQSNINTVIESDPENDGFMQVTHLHKKRRKKKLKSNAVFSNCKENIISDYSIGCEVLSKAKWFELLEAERSKDEVHNNFLDSLYKGNGINLRELSRYKIFNKETIDKDNFYETLLWEIAPIIVKTN